MQLEPQIFIGQNLFIDGQGMLGALEELETPEIKLLTAEVMAPNGKKNVPLPKLENALEIKFKLSHINPLIHKMMNPLVPTLFFVKKTLEENGVAKDYKITFKGKGISHKQSQDGEKIVHEYRVVCDSYFEAIEGVPMYAIDLNNGILTIDAVEVGSKHYQNLTNIA